MSTAGTYFTCFKCGAVCRWNKKNYGTWYSNHKCIRTKTSKLDELVKKKKKENKEFAKILKQLNNYYVGMKIKVSYEKNKNYLEGIGYRLINTESRNIYFICRHQDQNGYINKCQDHLDKL